MSPSSKSHQQCLKIPRAYFGPSDPEYDSTIFNCCIRKQLRPQGHDSNGALIWHARNSCSCLGSTEATSLAPRPCRSLSSQVRVPSQLRNLCSRGPSFLLVLDLGKPIEETVIKKRWTKVTTCLMTNFCRHRWMTCGVRKLRRWEG